MSDEFSVDRAQALELLSKGLVERLPRFGVEFGWAMGARVPEDFKEPPPWVRRAILLLAVGDGRDPVPGVEDPEVDFSMFFGFGAGLASTAESFFNDILGAPIPEHGNGREKRLYENNAARVILGQLEALKTVLNHQVFEKCRDTPEKLAAYHEGQAIASSSLVTKIKGELSDESVRKQLLFFLGLFWPEAGATGSIASLHRWITEIGYVQCSPAAVEKVCAEIGFRAAGGRN